MRKEPSHAPHGAEQGKGQSIPCPCVPWWQPLPLWTQDKVLMPVNGQASASLGQSPLKYLGATKHIWECWGSDLVPFPNSGSCKGAFFCLGFDTQTSLQPPCPAPALLPSSPHMLFPRCIQPQAISLLPAPLPATTAHPTQLLGTSWMIKPGWCCCLPPTPDPGHTPSGANEGSPAPRALGKGLSWEIRQLVCHCGGREEPCQTLLLSQTKQHSQLKEL